ncbi:MAG: DASH family cryptochrome [Thermonemataceae bacterium]|nr:DASH family cryptochrome [Thermonemataceae bacterium]
MKHILVWLRNDLRLHDNELIYRASKKAEKVYVAYCLDIRSWQKTFLDFPKTDSFRTRFLIETLANLRASLRKIGGDLIVRCGKPEEEICKIAEKLNVQAVFASKESTFEELAVEKSLEQNLKSKKIEIQYFWTYTLYHLEDLPFPVAKVPDIFTDFRKAVEKNSEIRATYPTITQTNPLPNDFFAGEIPTLKELGLEVHKTNFKTSMQWKGGETAALERLNHYFWQSNNLRNYKETRNGLLGAEYSSKFSAWLALGAISPRYIYEEVQKYEKKVIKNQSTYWLIFELIWRDYFRFIAKKYGNLIFKEEGIKKEGLGLKNNRKIFEKWATGETGVPFIDANMRELNETGFMSNRGRQNVASFLVKDLKINWIWGAMYFESKLIDYDVCSNWGNWLYVAGVGNDPRENRYFNIVSQAKQYDPNADFVKFWLPKFRDLPSTQIYKDFSIADLIFS